MSLSPGVATHFPSVPDMALHTFEHDTVVTFATIFQFTATGIEHTDVQLNLRVV